MKRSPFPGGVALGALALAVLHASPVTRAQMAVFLVATFGLVPIPPI